MEQTPNKIEVFSLSIQYVGINKRCRNNERHFKSGFIEIPYNQGNYDVKEIHKLSHDYILSNVKELNSDVIVTLNHFTRSNEERFTVTQWEVFGKTNKQERFTRDLFNIKGK